MGAGDLRSGPFKARGAFRKASVRMVDKVFTKGMALGPIMDRSWEGR